MRTKASPCHAMLAHVTGVPACADRTLLWRTKNCFQQCCFSSAPHLEYKAPRWWRVKSLCRLWLEVCMCKRGICVSFSCTVLREWVLNQLPIPLLAASVCINMEKVSIHLHNSWTTSSDFEVAINGTCCRCHDHRPPTSSCFPLFEYRGRSVASVARDLTDASSLCENSLCAAGLLLSQAFILHTVPDKLT